MARGPFADRAPISWRANRDDTNPEFSCEKTATGAGRLFAVQATDGRAKRGAHHNDDDDHKNNNLFEGVLCAREASARQGVASRKRLVRRRQMLFFVVLENLGPDAPILFGTLVGRPKNAGTRP
jgi:hypothetical protein